MVEVYILSDTTVINALEDAANRGLDVRVMLEPHPYESSPVTVQSTLEKLKAAGIKVNETNPIFQLTHAKFLLLDGTTLFLLTANLSHAALGGTKQVTNREYLLEDSETADVNEAQTIFTTDWNRATPTLSDPDLLVSPINARVKLLALIASAQTNIQIEFFGVESGIHYGSLVFSGVAACENLRSI
jgi:cardiolipin synthase A/B